MELFPTAFGDYFAALTERRATALPTDRFHHCFGCGMGHPTGLRVRCFDAPDDEAAPSAVVSPIVVPHEYEGPPGAAHGGIVAAYLDEVLGGAVARATGKASVTGELTVRYVKPVPTETPLLGRGWLVAYVGPYVDVEGHLERFSDGVLLARARGRFFPVSR